MSLDWDISKIDDFENRCFMVASHDNDFYGYQKGDRVITGVLRTLIFSTMAIEIGVITEENYVEFYERLALWERGVGAWRRNEKREDVLVTLEEVKGHIGLRTNVFPKLPKTKFMEKLGKAMLEERRGRDRAAAHKAQEAEKVDG